MSQLIFPKYHAVSLHVSLASICGCAALLFGVTPICNAQAVGSESEASFVQSKSKTRQIGEVTSGLLAMQVNGSSAGPGLPMLGATSALSWERYKDSFKYKIPENFDRAIRKNDGQ